LLFSQKCIGKSPEKEGWAEIHERPLIKVLLIDKGVFGEWFYKKRLSKDNLSSYFV
jgi:hypothetical protein